LNSRKITDTNNSEITRNFLALKSKIKIVRPSNNVHECRDLLHTYMTVCSRQCKWRCHSSWDCFKWRTKQGNETGLMKKRTKRQILKN